MKHLKKTVGLAVGLASILAKLNEEKNPTFGRKLDLFFPGSKMQIRSFFLLCSLKNGDCELTNAKNNCRIDITKDAQSMG